MDRLITIRTYDLPLRGQAEKLLLEENGIQAFLADDNLVTTNWFLASAVGGAKLQVAEADAARALELLERQHAAPVSGSDGPKGTIDFACESCQQAISVSAERRGGVETCPHCGAYVDVPEETQLERKLPPSPRHGDALPAQSTADESRWLWWEVFAVLCLVVIPSVYYSAWQIHRGYVPRSSVAYRETSLIIFELQIVMPVLVIIKLRREPWSQFGIVRFSWFLDGAFGVVIWLAMELAWLALVKVTPAALLDLLPAPNYQHARPQGMAEHLLLLMGCLSVGFGEEFVMRGYLLTRLKRLLHSTGWAIVAGAALFAICHAYQGAAGMVVAAATGLVMGATFCMLGRLWPLCLAHALHNFLAGL